MTNRVSWTNNCASKIHAIKSTAVVCHDFSTNGLESTSLPVRWSLLAEKFISAIRSTWYKVGRMSNRNENQFLNSTQVLIFYFLFKSELRTEAEDWRRTDREKIKKKRKEDDFKLPLKRYQIQLSDLGPGVFGTRVELKDTWW